MRSPDPLIGNRISARLVDISDKTSPQRTCFEGTNEGTIFRRESAVPTLIVSRDFLDSPLLIFFSALRPLPLKALTCQQAQQRKNIRLFDYIVGGGEQRRRHLKAEGSCRVEVDYKLEFRRLQHRQISRSGAL
jgi:hypothetical protein